MNTTLVACCALHLPRGGRSHALKETFLKSLSSDHRRLNAPKGAPPLRHVCASGAALLDCRCSPGQGCWQRSCNLRRHSSCDLRPECGVSSAAPSPSPPSFIVIPPPPSSPPIFLHPPRHSLRGGDYHVCGSVRLLPSALRVMPRRCRSSLLSNDEDQLGDRVRTARAFARHEVHPPVNHFGVLGAVAIVILLACAERMLPLLQPAVVVRDLCVHCMQGAVV